jgi:hypothetical protein
MKTAFWFRNFLLLGASVILLATPVTTLAGDLIDGMLVISEGSEQEVSPSLAYNSQRYEYLAVWYNDRPGCDDVRAQRISAIGKIAGPPFYISAGCNPDRRYPDVAYNSAHDQYLVVWEQQDISSGYSIRGRRVSGDGQVLDTTDIDIRSYGYNLYTPTKPAVAYASTSDRYLVVWAETWHPMPITYDIYGQVIASDGSLEGSRFSISTGTASLEEPDVAYNRHANRYLVVWQVDTGALYDIHGQQVHGGGGLYQGDITIAYFIKSCTNPAVAAIPASPVDEKFLVVWEVLYAPSDHDIYGRLVKEDGTTGTDFWISWENAVDETSPAITASENNLQYFVSWRSPQGVVDKPIKARAISYAGVLLDGVFEFSGVNADHPALAAGPAGEIIAAWQDQPISTTNTDIYGRLWGMRVYLPMIIRD